VQFAVIISNPPYMGSKHFSKELREWSAKNYPMTKGDLYTMFIERCIEITKPLGVCSMLTPQNWMFLSSSEKLRLHILANAPIINMLHLGDGVFGGGAVVNVTAFTLTPGGNKERVGKFLRLVDVPPKDKESTAYWNIRCQAR